MISLATFRLTGGSGCSAARVSQRLGLTPSYRVEAGCPLDNGPPPRRAATSVWGLSSARQPREGVELAAALACVLDFLEPVAGVVWELVGEGYWANWFCYLGSATTDPAVALDRATLARLLALPGELWLDVYPDNDPHEDA